MVKYIGRVSAYCDATWNEVDVFVCLDDDLGIVKGSIELIVSGRLGMDKQMWAVEKIAALHDLLTVALQESLVVTREV
jgi:hypothetical protein